MISPHYLFLYIEFNAIVLMIKGEIHMKKYIGWILTLYSLYAILYGQFGRTQLRFTHSPFYYVSFIFLVLGILLLLSHYKRR